ncbi:MAG: DinB family protein [bacterium]|nr:DinB family protein [bacterium]
MKPSVIEKPAVEEFNAYYGGYISQVTEPDLLGVLASQPNEVTAVFGSLDESRGTFAYAEGKWTIKELLSHVIDGERHFAHRVHRISRGDMTPIEGFEQDHYIATSHAHERTFADLVAEFSELRQANLRSLRSLDESDWLQIGTASGFPISVRALGFIMAGHVRHHVNILKDRYLA